MQKRSAGLLMYRMRDSELQVFLVHPGGPFWIKKDAGAWSLPKGEYQDAEDPLAAAVREFKEETGLRSVAPSLSWVRSSRPATRSLLLGHSKEIAILPNSRATLAK